MEARELTPAEQVPASRKLGESEARAIAKGSARIIVARGTRVVEYPGGPRPSAELIAAMLGTTGNLRAPLLRVGKVALVGFHEESYAGVLGG